MKNALFYLNRRQFLAASAGIVPAGGVLGSQAQAQQGSAASGGPRRISLKAAAGTAAWAASGHTPVWALDPPFLGRQARGGVFTVDFQNALPVPVVPAWYGIDGLPDARPFTGQPPVPPGGRAELTLPLSRAGTFLCDLRLIGARGQRPLPAAALVVTEAGPTGVDRDDVLLIEDWRLASNGMALAPGADPGPATTAFTINGRTTYDLSVRANERLRLRFVNACHRSIVALKVDSHDVRVMAIDSEPAEPFVARESTVILAPGTRLDAFIDAGGAPGTVASILLHDGTSPRSIGRLLYARDAPVRPAPLPEPQPLPSTGLPDRLDLQRALRTELVFDGMADSNQWIVPQDFGTGTPPAFTVRRDGVAVLALTNRAKTTAVFHLHGHHARLLDRLDDGWKPYWLDTVSVAAGQTQRIAFAAAHAGTWLIEAMAADWAAPKLVRCYRVE